MNIMKELEDLSSEKAAQGTARLVKTGDRILGVPGRELDKLAVRYWKTLTWEELDNLWSESVLEAKILAAKILGRKASKEPDKALETVARWAGEIDNWAVCDVLATQGLRKAFKKNPEAAEDFVGKEYEEGERRGKVFLKRLAMVASISLARQGRPAKARELLQKTVDARDPMIVKARKWTERELMKKRE